MRFEKKVTGIIVLILTCMFSPQVHLYAQKIEVTLDHHKLDAGKIQTIITQMPSDTGKRKRVIGIMLINAPPDIVWNVLKNWDEMSEFVPSLEYYKTIRVLTPVKKDVAGESLIEGLLKVAFLKIRYTLKVTFDEKNLRQDWRLVTEKEISEYAVQNITINKSSAILKNIEGFEYIEPYADGRKTLYYYAPVVEVAGPVPGWIERKISEGSLTEYMEGVKKKAEQMMQNGGHDGTDTH